MDDIDTIAEGLLDGSMACPECPELEKAIEDVKMGALAEEDFKALVRSSMDKLKGIS